MRLTETQGRALWYLVPVGLALTIIAVWALGAFVFVEAWDQLLSRIVAAQRELQQDLSSATRSAAEHGFSAAWTLIGLSFVYGVLHAAGPGHGKFVISTYLFSQESAVPRSLMLATLSSLMQGITAIVIIEVVVAILGIGLRQATGLANELEITSYALVMLIGLILAGVTLRRFMRRGQDNADACGHCGHVHAIDAPHGARKSSLAELAAIVFSVGLRPCTGAILVLVLANALGLRFTAWAAVLAMSAGTAITVSALAVMAVYARRTTLRLAERWPSENRNLPVVLDAIAFCGGIAIVLLGISLIRATTATTGHPLL
ncbi:MAG: nickel/cobalt transporter [Alphaproteobacteria bacterium]|nr:nickel/cobalt transporter [Alphaproteobacteria bacterium]